jgi:hypothetical protein
MSDIKAQRVAFCLILTLSLLYLADWTLARCGFLHLVTSEKALRKQPQLLANMASPTTYTLPPLPYAYDVRLLVFPWLD